MGEVYRARDVPSRARCRGERSFRAISCRDPDRLARFATEAQSASALNHPNIVTVHEIGEVQRAAPYLVMEFVDGRTLRELLTQRRVPTKKLLPIASPNLRPAWPRRTSRASSIGTLEARERDGHGRWPL